MTPRPAAPASPEFLPAAAPAPDPRPGPVLEPPAGGLTPEWVLAALRDVADPEWPVSVVDMGLIYKVEVAHGIVAVTLTFTSTACPCMDMIRDDIRDRLLHLAGVRDVVFTISWDPPWTKDRLSAAAREQLRQWGVAV